MPIKDILVGLSTRTEQDHARDFAVSMATTLAAHLTAVAYALEPAMPFSLYPELTADLLQRHRNETRTATERARNGLIQAADRAGVRRECHTGSATLSQATTDFAMRLRTADIAVLMQHQQDDLERVGDLFVEAALFQSGRPVIVVPKDHASGFSLDRILVAWDADIHATRALAAAMPLLERAGEIEVLTVREASKEPNLRGQDLVRHLRMHDLHPNLTERDDPDVPQAIRRQAEVFRASLVVMGAYGHSRLRELVFGGATRLMLTSMPVPVLLAH